MISWPSAGVRSTAWFATVFLIRLIPPLPGIDMDGDSIPAGTVGATVLTELERGLQHFLHNG